MTTLPRFFTLSALALLLALDLVSQAPHAATQGTLASASRGKSTLSLTKLAPPSSLKTDLDFGAFANSSDNSDADLIESGQLGALSCLPACRLVIDSASTDELLRGQGNGDLLPFRFALDGTQYHFSVDAEALRLATPDNYVGIIELLIETE